MHAATSDGVDAQGGARARETQVFDTPSDDPSSGSGTRRVDPNPSKIGRYTVLESLGVGGMGWVCAAYDPKLDRKVAIKLLRPSREGTADKEQIRQNRLFFEAQTLAKLSHPNIVTVHDVDTCQGRLYVAMEYVDGQTVGEWVHRAKPGWREILRVYEHAGRGLSAAHAAKIVHRDFKPSNVMIGRDGRVRVLDFGLAKHHGRADDRRSGADELPFELASPPQLTQAGRVLGTPGYMAPEQRASGDAVSPASDQYSFAASLYESLYGSLPPSEPGRELEAPRDADAPARVFRVLRRALSLRASDRFPSMDALLSELAVDPGKRRARGWMAAGAGTVTTAALAGLLALLGAREAPCRNAAHRWAEVWNDELKSSLASAMHRTGAPYAADTAQRVQAAFDAYGERWIAARARVCEATRVHREQSEALLDIRMACLDQREREAAALLRVLSEADEGVVEQAMAAVYRLRSPDQCVSAEARTGLGTPPDPAIRAAVQRVRADLDRTVALMMAGRYDDAMERARRARTRAEDLPCDRTVARALLEEGRALRYAGRGEEAMEALQAAVRRAARSGDAEVEVGAWSNLLYLAAEHPAQAEAYRLAARAALVREGESPELLLALRLNEGAVDLRAERWDAAEEAHREVLRLGEQLGGLEEPNVVTAWMNLGVIAARRGRSRDAEAALSRVLELSRRLYGPRHPRVADAALNLANVVLRARRPEEAEALYLEALAIRESAYGPEEPLVAEARNGLGVLFLHKQEWNRAEDAFRRALASLPLEGAVELRSATLNNLGALAHRRGRVDVAVAFHRAALEELERGRGEDEPGGDLAVGRTHMRICESETRAEQADRARQSCDRAIDLLGPVYGVRSPALLALERARDRLLAIKAPVP